MSSRMAVKSLLGVSLVFSVSLAYGSTLTAQGSFSISPASTSSNSGLSDSQIQTTDNSDLNLWVGPSIYSAQTIAKAGQDGTLITSARGAANIFNASASAGSSTTITNDSGGTLHYYYTLNIGSSYLSINSSQFHAGDVFSASNQFGVDLNGATIWSSFASMNMTSGSLTNTTSGQPLDWAFTNDPNTYGGSQNKLSLSGYSLQLDLGEWLNGQSLTVNYNLLSSILANAPNACSYECFNVDAFISDPSGLSGKSMISGEPVAAVPVPAAAWLLGSGLLGMIGVARRKVA